MSISTSVSALKCEPMHAVQCCMQEVCRHYTTGLVGILGSVEMLSSSSIMFFFPFRIVQAEWNDAADQNILSGVNNSMYNKYPVRKIQDTSLSQVKRVNSPFTEASVLSSRLPFSMPLHLKKKILKNVASSAIFIINYNMKFKIFWQSSYVLNTFD